MSLANCCITRLMFEKVAMPTGAPVASTTGSRDMRRSDITRAASTTSVSGRAVCNRAAHVQENGGHAGVFTRADATDSHIPSS